MKPRKGKVVTDPVQLAARINAAARPLVFTNGCFDVLHRGHVNYLAQAAELGRTLLVAINTDASVRRLGKGDDRPLNTLADRLAVLAALECVDLVTSFDSDTPIELIRQLAPDHLVKGGDWAEDQIVGADIVRAAGGEVHSIPIVHERSTTALIDRIREHTSASR